MDAEGIYGEQTPTPDPTDEPAHGGDDDLSIPDFLRR